MALIQALRPNPDSSTPLYHQLSTSLRELIVSGALRSGEAVPAERDLAEMIEVSRVTVRKAIAKLVESGLLIQRPSAGTFVTGRFEQPLSELSGFSEDMQARGFEPGSRWLEKTRARANPEEAMALGVAPNTPIIRFERVRTANGEPIAVERAVVSATDLTSPEAVVDSLYAALRERELVPVRALQRIRAALAGQREAELLGIVRPVAILRIERRAFLTQGRAVEVTWSTYRADLYDFVAELNIKS